MPGFGLRTLCEMNFKTYLFYKISSRDNYCTKLSPRVQFSLVLWVDSDHGGLHYLHSVRTVLSFCHNSKDCKDRNSKQMTRSVITICTWCESQFLIAVILSYLSLRSWLNNVSRHFKLRWYLLHGIVSKQRTRQSSFSSFTLRFVPPSFQHVNELKHLAHPLDLEPSVYILP